MPENKEVQENRKPILIFRELSADEKMRYLSEMREKALHDEANAINSAKKRGRIAGIEEGKAVREAEIIENLRKIGMSEEQIESILNNKQ